MDTLLQDLRSALQTLSGYPAFSVAAAMSLGLSLQNGPAQRLPAPRAERRTVRAVHVVPPAPHRTASWMDYIDFRRGSGDVLRWIGPSTLDDPPDHPDHPHTCGAGE
jgi:ABC-type protease/lipase transport system fused ATPase/permease subunit